MIHTLTGSTGIQVHNGYSGGHVYVNGDLYQLGPGQIGELRMLGNAMYVWNGSWTNISNGVTTVELSSELISVLDWARTAKRREEELDTLIKKYPAVKSAKDNLDVVVALTRDYSKD